MPIYRAKMVSRYTNEITVLADNPSEACENLDTLKDSGNYPDLNSGSWSGIEYEEPEEICPYCYDPIKGFAGLPCCREQIVRKGDHCGTNKAS